MEKLRFEFALLPGSDGKSNMLTVTSIATSADKVYAIPEEVQAVTHHRELMKTSAFTKVKNSLKKRHQVRRVWISMSEELERIYIDEDGNLQFADQFLEEINQEKFEDAQQTHTNTLEKLYERLNQTLTNKIRCKINEKVKKKAWTNIAQECVEKYNNTNHSVTGFTPSYLLYGKKSTILPKELHQTQSTNEWITDRKTALEKTIKSHNYNKNLFDKNRIGYDFKEGDMVYVENGNKLNRKKLDELKIGPYKITEKISNTIYRIDTGHKKTESNLYHITKLQPVPILEDMII